jgi:hypothetical protein
MVTAFGYIHSLIIIMPAVFFVREIDILSARFHRDAFLALDPVKRLITDDF